MTQQTQGHSATNPGLRAHSVGVFYPRVVIRYGNGDFAAFNCRTGRYAPRRHSSFAARLDVLVGNV